ncbi:MAG: dihydropteroate synthase [Bacteroidales bacterium]
MLPVANYININGQLIDLNIPRVMGILNITPDSFYAGSRVQTEKEIIEKAGKLLTDGADFIDIGGYSTRPGAANVSEKEESERVLGAIRLVKNEYPSAVLSIDTFRASIARIAVVEFGASIINDISGGELDPLMFDVVKELNVPYIMMHMQGTPATMQNNPVYDDIVADILRWFAPKVVSLQRAGVKDIILDPGFGFGKTIAHNFELLDRFEELRVAGLPLLAGLSRKSMIWRSLGITPDEALPGTLVLNTLVLTRGAGILRVHDVREAVQAIRLVNLTTGPGRNDNKVIY